jgi:N-acetylmuramic acid 6-phosphate etherase
MSDIRDAHAHALPPTERQNPATERLDTMSAAELLRLMSDEDAKVAEAVARVLPAIERGVAAITVRLADGGRLVYLGAGTSGRIAVMEAAEARPTFGVPEGTVIGIIAGGDAAVAHGREGAEDDAEAGATAVRRLEPGRSDVVAGVSASGRTPFVLGAVEEARRRGAFTIGVSCDGDAPLASVPEVAITPDVGPELIAGSTRLKAGTAQKLVLNMLTTVAMIRLGRVHGGLMIDVLLTNEKLRRRARRIVEQITGHSGPEVDRALETAGSARIAIVMLARGVDADAARQLVAGGASLESLLDSEGGDRHG